MPRLDGRVAVVTGGAIGIGGGVARWLAAEGASVVIADVEVDLASENAERINQAGGRAVVIEANVADDEDARRIIDRALDEWGRLDILINNAFNPVPDTEGSVEDVPEPAWDAGIAGLVKPIYLAMRYAEPHLRDAGGGSIVNVASVHGIAMSPETAVYEAGKAGVIGLTRQAACDFGPDGIGVNAILPGHIVTSVGRSGGRRTRPATPSPPSNTRSAGPAHPTTSAAPRRSSRPTTGPSSRATPSSSTAD